MTTRRWRPTTPTLAIPVPIYTQDVAAEAYSRHLIRMARRQARLSQADLATRAGTSQAAVSAYESGKRSPSVDTLCRLLAAAGFEVRMRLAAPDTHEPTLRRAEAILPADQVAAHNERERRRVARVANA
jgi:transcriptional regulator with XRE-family HTH domain